MNFNELHRSLERFPEESIVFVGLGNPGRGDDAAGLVWIRTLRKTTCFRKSHFIEAGTNPENILETIIGFQPKAIVFADAARMNRTPGSIARLNTEDLDSCRISTHAFSLKLIEMYIRANVDARFYYLGIQPCSTGLGEGISSQVGKGLEAFFNPMNQRRI